ncbi:IS110 family transposase [Jeotgalibaca sp. MA1X17-3]|uniref:IS110 family transposase n=1 Tax=Jeotgalibaca sp. MA1X17-3 TaxID=2908211 RepID=UPI001F435ECE|nr:IS110 family transposase [Jeotgalibaca sp. MA1X17-3]UJF15653.1 IS110 family transposase [Jeotgalibaca sp. MA1X17-3]
MFVVALDVSMKKSYAVIYEGNTCLWEGIIAHTRTGFGILLNEIRNLPRVPDMVFEATGVYSRPVEAFCQKNDLSYTLLNPLQAKKQMEEDTLRSWKTDKQDAHKLAQTHAGKRRTPKVVQEDVYQDLRDLSRFYQEVEEEIKRTRMHLHNCLQLVFPELEQFFSNQINLYALTVISQFPHPDLVLRSTPTKIKNLLIKSTRKNISENRARKKAEELTVLAQEAYPAVAENSVHCQKTSYYAEKLQDLLLQKEALKSQMIAMARELPEHDLYITIPGIGELSSALLIGELGDIRRFETSNQLNAFVGIDIRRYQSGNYIGKDHINKRGNPKGRKILFFCVRNMVRQQRAAPNHIVDYYYKLKKQPIPKKDKVAVVACMNKLLKCMHSMVRNHTKYDYAYTASKGPSTVLI